MVDAMNMHRDGTFTVELVHPIKQLGGEVDALTMHPLTWEQVMRWQSGEIEARLALVAESSRVPEKLLRLLVHPDINRVMFAFTYTLPAELREDFSDPKRPLCSPDFKLEQKPEERVGDPDDPRFPHVDGPIKKFPVPPQVNIPQRPRDEGSGFKADIPDVMKAINSV